MSFDDVWKYSVVITEPNYGIVADWCDTYIGKFDIDWYKLGVDPALWLSGNTETIWYFTDEQKAIHFKLRWS